MPNSVQASTPVVIDAGYVRLAELGTRLKYLRDNHQPRTDVVASIIDLRQKMEALALTNSLTEQDTLKQYLQETYGLLSVYTDPLLRPLLPLLPATGSRIRRFVLAVNNKALVVNTKLIGLGGELVTSTAAPVFNTLLTPGQTSGAVTYNGDAGSSLSFDLPPASAGGTPPYLLLFVLGTQVGRVDFPLSAMGSYFRLVNAGVSYLGMFQAVPLPAHLALQPE